MLQQTARVLERHDNTVRVCTRAATHCARCAQGRGCGGGLIGALIARGDTSLVAACNAQMSVGDQVNVQLPERALIEAAALAYLLPLMTMLLALAFAVMSGAGDALSAAVAMAGLLLGATLARRIVRRARLERWRPVAVPQTSTQPS